MTPKSIYHLRNYSLEAVIYDVIKETDKTLSVQERGKEGRLYNRRVYKSELNSEYTHADGWYDNIEALRDGARKRLEKAREKYTSYADSFSTLEKKIRGMK